MVAGNSDGSAVLAASLAWQEDLRRARDFDGAIRATERYVFALRGLAGSSEAARELLWVEDSLVLIKPIRKDYERDLRRIRDQSLTTDRREEAMSMAITHLSFALYQSGLTKMDGGGRAGRLRHRHRSPRLNGAENASCTGAFLTCVSERYRAI